jgi:hypothetical protein
VPHGDILDLPFSHCSVTYADEIAAASALASTQEAAASSDADVMVVMYGRDGRCGVPGGRRCCVFRGACGRFPNLSFDTALSLSRSSGSQGQSCSESLIPYTNFVIPSAAENLRSPPSMQLSVFRNTGAPFLRSLLAKGGKQRLCSSRRSNTCAGCGAARRVISCAAPTAFITS